MAAITLVCLTLPALALDMPAVSGEKQRQPADNAALTGDHETIAAPLPDPDAAEPANHLGWEWFGMKLGIPMLWDSNNKDREMYYVHDIILPTYRWQWAYVTTGELTLQLAAFDAGITTGGGCRLPLGHDLNYELRIGATFGYRYRIYESLSSLILSPQVQVIANFHRFSLGIGVDVPVFFNLTDYSAFTGPGPFIQRQVLLYLRFSVT